MKHTTEELILAGMVIEMAGKLRDGSLPQGATDDELAAWHEDNPTEKFIPDIVHVLGSVADNIYRLRTEA